MTQNNTPRRSGLSQQSAVERLVSQAQAEQKEIANKTAGRDGRGRPGNAGERGKDKTGASKATYALPTHRQELVREMADAEDVSQTDIIEAAIVALYNAWKAGRVDFGPIKTGAKSLRVTWHLEVEDTFFLA